MKELSQLLKVTKKNNKLSTEEQKHVSVVLGASSEGIYIEANQLPKT